MVKLDQLKLHVSFLKEHGIPVLQTKTETKTKSGLAQFRHGSVCHVGVRSGTQPGE
jgi:hypothetical protein